MNYAPPTHVLEVLQKIEFEEALAADDPRYVDTWQARDSEKKPLNRLARKFGLGLGDGQFFPPTKKHVLFFGHIGSGKTTELRRYALELDTPTRFFVVEVDITRDLDHNNLQYADTLIAMASALLRRLDGAGVRVDPYALRGLEDWFAERVLSNEDTKEFADEVKAGVEVTTGLPYLLKMFAKFTTSFKSNVTYKETLRRVVRNNFTQLAMRFNDLLRTVEEELPSKQCGKRVLFIIDGTDKLRGEDTRRFFVEDAEQLLAIESLVIYTAPLGLKYEGNIANKLDADMVLPMIKLFERVGTRCEAGWEVMRNILLLRADRSLFSSATEVDSLVEYSGGHPRELLRLLKLCCEFAEEGVIDARVVALAVKQLASEYRRFLEPEDYVLLSQLDHDDSHSGNDERTRRLLYQLALLEYNDGTWRRSHPVVRTLEGYRRSINTPEII